MRIGIYNQYLHTYGGGEKHSLSIGQVLSKKYEVDLITHEHVSKEKLEKRLNIDLRKIVIRYLPKTFDNYEISEISKEYDFFMNASYMSSISSKAKKSLLLIYFPTPLPKKDIMFKILHPIKSRGIVYLSGFYENEKTNYNTSVQWTKDIAKVKVPILKKGSTLIIKLRIGNLRPEGIVPPDFSVYVGNYEIQKFNLPISGFATYKLIVPSKFTNSSNLIIELRTSTFNPYKEGISTDSRDLGIAVEWIKPVYEDFLSRSYNFLKYLPSFYVNISPSRYLKTYDIICANSKYTQKWIKKLWGVDAEVLYPPIDIDFFKPMKKRNYILSVGRFFEGGHNKKHIPMIKTFISLCNEGLKDWEYHLVGGTHKEEMHQKYLEKVKYESKGYPIFIHTDIPFDHLLKLYGVSKIFWHATGLGEDENRHPERFEHFGITTVEAMSAGCVPLVIGKAGQLEIIQSGINGFLWKDLDELKNKTKYVITNVDVRKKIRKNAIEKSKEFSRKKFEENVNMIADVLLR